MMERSEITWGRTRIAYEVRRSARRSTVSLAVDPVEGLLVTAPSAASIEQLDRVVRGKARWVAQRLHEVREAAPPRELVSGATFSYLGRQYRLRVQGGGAGVALRAGWLEVSVPPGLLGPARSARVRAELIGWYQQRAEARLPMWVTAWAEKLGVGIDKVIVTDQAKRWGSCSNGVLRFNWRIIQAPRPLVDYVVVHEIMHRKHPHHGPEFWRSVGRVYPTYEQAKARLKELGPALVW